MSHQFFLFIYSTPEVDPESVLQVLYHNHSPPPFSQGLYLLPSLTPPRQFYLRLQTFIVFPTYLLSEDVHLSDTLTMIKFHDLD